MSDKLEQDIQFLRNMIFQVGTKPFDPEPEPDGFRLVGRPSSVYKAEFAADAVASYIRDQDKAHQDKLQQTKEALYWLKNSLEDATLYVNKLHRILGQNDAG